MPTLHPTLYVAVGTSGVTVMRHLQQIFIDEFGTACPGHVRVVVLETEKVSKSALQGIGLPSHPVRVVQLSMPKRQIRDKVKRELARREHASTAGPGAAPESVQIEALADWVDLRVFDDVAGDGHGGAGNRRHFGRVLLWHCYDTVYGSCDAALRELRNDSGGLMNQARTAYAARHGAEPDIADELHVMVTGTLMGGTCSGTFLDLGSMLQGIAGGNAAVTGYFSIPHPGQAAANNAKALPLNTVGALQELSYAMNEGRRRRLVMPGFEDTLPYNAVILTGRQDLDSGEVARLNAVALYLLSFSEVADKINANRVDINQNAQLAGTCTQNGYPRMHQITVLGISAAYQPVYQLAARAAAAIGRMVENRLAGEGKTYSPDEARAHAESTASVLLTELKHKFAGAQQAKQIVDEALGREGESRDPSQAFAQLQNLRLEDILIGKARSVREAANNIAGTGEETLRGFIVQGGLPTAQIMDAWISAVVDQLQQYMRKLQENVRPVVPGMRVTWIDEDYLTECVSHYRRLSGDSWGRTLLRKETVDEAGRRWRKAVWDRVRTLYELYTNSLQVKALEEVVVRISSPQMRVFANAKEQVDSWTKAVADLEETTGAFAAARRITVTDKNGIPFEDGRINAAVEQRAVSLAKHYLGSQDGDYVGSLAQKVIGPAMSDGKPFEPEALLSWLTGQLLEDATQNTASASLAASIVQRAEADTASARIVGTLRHGLEPTVQIIPDLMTGIDDMSNWLHAGAHEQFLLVGTDAPALGQLAAWIRPGAGQDCAVEAGLAHMVALVRPFFGLTPDMVNAWADMQTRAHVAVRNDGEFTVYSEKGIAERVDPASGDRKRNAAAFITTFRVMYPSPEEVGGDGTLELKPEGLHSEFVKVHAENAILKLTGLDKRYTDALLAELAGRRRREQEEVFNERALSFIQNARRELADADLNRPHKLRPEQLVLLTRMKHVEHTLAELSGAPSGSAGILDDLMALANV